MCLIGLYMVFFQLALRLVSYSSMDSIAIVLLLCDKGSRKQSLSNSPADTQIESGRLPISAAWAFESPSRKR